MELNLNCPLNFVSYGIVSQNIFDKLLEHYLIYLFPINPNVEVEPRLQQRVQDAIVMNPMYNYNAPTLKIWHQWDYIMPGRGKKIGFPIFELDSLTPMERHHLSSLDMIVVCSNWAAKVLHQHGFNNVKVAPLGVNRDIFTAKSYDTNDTIFLNVGKWEKRKGHDILAECFKKAFDGKKNVQLWMCTYNFFLNQDEASDWENLYNHPQIKVLPRLDQNSLLKVMNQASFGVFPSRAEGWNLPLSEMMVLGKPSIVTNYSAHTEFCSDETSLLIDIDEIEQANDGKWFIPGRPVNQGRWAKIGENQKEQIIHSMIGAHDLYQNRRNEYLQLCQKNLTKGKELTWDNCVKQIITCL